MFTLPNPQAQVTSAAFAQAQLSFGSGLLRSAQAVKTHLTKVINF
jgi:hypothetical protein